MIINDTDLSPNSDGSIDLKAVCHKCDKEVQIQLSHYRENEILVIPHECAK